MSGDDGRAPDSDLSATAHTGRAAGAWRGRSTLIFSAAVPAALLKLQLALRTAGTLDVAAYADFARTFHGVGGVGLYHDPGAYSP